MLHLKLILLNKKWMNAVNLTINMPFTIDNGMASST